MPGSARQNVIVALSGGVDSAVAALLLLRAGHTVQGLHMTNWDDEEGYCTAAQDFRDAREVCRELGITLHHVNFAREYRERVFTGFLAELRAGRTPNPDVSCNREIKFGTLRAYARRLGAERVATGHYARLRGSPPGTLLRGVDRSKDQSYFLHAVPRAALATALFPLGELDKAGVRDIARNAGLPVFDKRDSTGICFIGERPFRAFLRRHLPAASGDIETMDGEVIGRHDGLCGYTIGQRRGLGIGGRSGRSDEAWYVAAKDLGRNVLFVVQGHDHPALYCAELQAGPPHWISREPAALADGGPLRCGVQTRYRQRDVPASLYRLQDGRIRVQFEDPQRAVTPGQYAVFYRGDECLGGSVIENTSPARESSTPNLAATA